MTDYCGKRVQVCFNYDTENYVEGTVVKDDVESTLIRLDDGRVVKSTECQYRVI